MHVDIKRALDLMGRTVNLDKVRGYTAIGFQYFEKDYVEITVSNINADGAKIQFNVESWRVYLDV